MPTPWPWPSQREKEALWKSARISPEIARVVNNHRDWQNPQPVRGTGPRPQGSLPQPQGYHGPDREVHMVLGWGRSNQIGQVNKILLPIIATESDRIRVSRLSEA